MQPDPVLERARVAGRRGSGARLPEQVRENLATGDWDLPEALWARLDEAARYDLGYPKVWMDSTFPATFGEEEF